MKQDERHEALSFIRRLGRHGLSPHDEAIRAQGWPDAKLRPYLEASQGWLEDVTGVTGMRGEYDDDGLAEEVHATELVVGEQQDRWGGVPHDIGHPPRDWMGLIGEHAEAICCMTLTDPAFPSEMRRIAALALSACLAYRYARYHVMEAHEAGGLG